MSSLRRLFSDQPLGGTGSTVPLDPRESHHGRDVLRLRPGDHVAVFDAEGRQFAATVGRSDKTRLLVTLAEPIPAVAETSIPIVLHLALVKAPAFDSILPQAVELGVSRIVPFVAARSVSIPPRAGAQNRKLERWRAILLSATKQCGRARLTAIDPPRSFDDAVLLAEPQCRRFCCATASGGPPLSEALRSLDLAKAKSLAVMIGPEGGFEDDEIRLASRNDWELVSLGPRILRVETAATAALVLFLQSMHDT